MTLGLERYYGDDDLHFITCSCYHRQPVLNTPAARDLFLRVLEETRTEFNFRVFAYVVMPEHFHLLIGEPIADTPSTVLQVLKQRFARKLDKNTKAPAESAWQRRFYDFNVRTDRKRIEKIRYIHRNPVKRGLVNRPEDWKWSSFRFYANGESGPVAIIRELISSFQAPSG
jgi:putative transposase